MSNYVIMEMQQRKQTKTWKLIFSFFREKKIETEHGKYGQGKYIFS